MSDSNLNIAALLVTGFVTGTVLGTTVVLELGDYLPTGFPFSTTERLQWETLFAGLTALCGGYMAFMAAIHPLKHRKRQKSRKLAMQLLSRHLRTFGTYLAFIRNNTNTEEVMAALTQTREDITKEVRAMLDYVMKLDLDPDIYSDTAEQYREIVTYALADALRAEDLKKFLRKLKVAEQVNRDFINIFADEKFELEPT